MKKRSAVITIAVMSLLFTPMASALMIDNFGVDTAPNIYGSPDWAAWYSQTQSDLADGSFVNMQSGVFSGELCADPYELIVYSTGDLGSRLHWSYYIDGVDVAELDGLIETRWVTDWDGAEWVIDGGSWANAAPNLGWTSPTSLENYGSGVTGHFGFAWWATDDNALPYDTGGTPYDETDQADIDALWSDVAFYQDYVFGEIRWRDDVNSDWRYASLNVGIKPSDTVVPEPASMTLLGLGIAGMAARRKLRELFEKSAT